MSLIMKKTLIVSLIIFSVFSVCAQRRMENLDRGLVALPNLSGDSTYVSWRMFGTEYYDVDFNLYRNGTKVNDTPLHLSNMMVPGIDATATYSVAPVVRGKEGARSKVVTPWQNDYLDIKMASMQSRKGADISSDYEPNDCACADLTGDGRQELIVRRIYLKDTDPADPVIPTSNDSAYNVCEIYTLGSERLWWIDMGPNMVSGPDSQWDVTAYDWDEDGKAEVLFRGTDDVRIHTADGEVIIIGKPVNLRSHFLHTANMSYQIDGDEYLVYLNGATGKPYQILPYPLPRLEAGETNIAEAWGDGYGHRANKHFVGAPYLDGRHPSIFLGRGIYTRHRMVTYDVNPETHELIQRWRWECSEVGSPWFGQGYHNYGIADVDLDGRDEICYGSMVIDDNGQGLSTCGLGHGDAQHHGDFDPYNHGLEIFTCNEDRPSCNYRDATTAKEFFRVVGSRDDGRCMFGNFHPEYPGAEGGSAHSGVVSGVGHCSIVNSKDLGSGSVFRMYWDGDLYEDGQGGIDIYNYKGFIKRCNGCESNNGTKATPSLTADLFGDWRDELVLRTSDGEYLRIFHTQHYTPWRNYTQMHDIQYRNGMVWEQYGYNQPPHTSYFLGELENITATPPPLISNEREVVEVNGVVTSAMNDKHVLLAPTAQNGVFTIEDGVNPYILTVNTPSWVQGHTNNDFITYDYFTYNVNSGVLSGDMRFIKQGDGELKLSKNTHTYNGETKVWGGTLLFDGELTSSPLELYFFSTLKSDGGKFSKGITMRYDAALSPGTEAKAGTITTSDIRMEFGAKFVFDLFSDGSADRIIADYVKMDSVNWLYGPKVQRPVFEFVQHKQSGSDRMKAGRYSLGNIAKLIVCGREVTEKDQLKDIIVFGMSGTKYELGYEGGELFLDVFPLRDADELIWIGDENNLWNLDETENFRNSKGIASGFVTGDKVIFSDEANQTNITLTDELLPSILEFNSCKDFVLNGKDEYSFIGSTAKLIKSGAGKLIVNTINTYEGGTIIQGGTLEVASVANKYQDYGCLGKRSEILGNVTIKNGANLSIVKNCNMGFPLLFGEGGGVISAQGNVVAQFPLSSLEENRGIVTKQGDGTLQLTNPNGPLQKWIQEAGTTHMEYDHGYLADTLELRGGTFKDSNNGFSYSSFETPIVVPEGCTATFDTDSRCYYPCKLFGSGTLNLIMQWYRIALTGDWSRFTGTIVAKGDYGFALANNYGLPNATLDLSNGNLVTNSGTIFKIGRIIGGNNGILGELTFNSFGYNTWLLGWDKDDWSWGGVIIGAGTMFEKIGKNNVTLTGLSTFGGAAKVQEGTLTLYNGTLGSGILTVAKGARMVAKNTPLNPLKNRVFSCSGTLLIGTEANPYSGSFYLGGINASFGVNSILHIGIRRAATSTSPGGSCLQGVGSLTFNGTLEVEVMEGVSLSEGDSVRVWKAEKYMENSTPKFNFLNAPGEGLTWDTSRISEGVLYVVKDGVNALFNVTTDNIIRTEYYTPSGVKVKAPLQGVYLVKEYHTNDKVTTRKVLFNNN